MAKHVKPPSAVFKNPSIYERSDLKIGKFRVNSQTGKNETYSGTDWLPGKWIYHSKNIPIPTKHVLFDDVHGYGKSIGNAYGPWLELTEEVIQYGYDQPRPLGIGQWKSLEVLMPNLNKFFTQEYIDLLYDVSESIKPSSSAGINKYLYHKVLNNILLSNGGGQVAATYAANYNIAHDSDIEIAPFESTNRDTFW